MIQDNGLDWTPPKGLRRILKEEWDVIVAQHKLNEAIHKENTND